MVPDGNYILGRKLTGLPVITASKGIELGEVREIIYQPTEQRIVAVLLEEGGWLKGAKLVNWENLKHIGEDAVTVPGEEVILDSHSDSKLQQLCKNRGGLKGYRLLTEKGLELGSIEDILFNPSTGEIVGYELSQGVVQDLLDGRWEAFLPEHSGAAQIVIGDDTVVIPDGYAQIFQPD